MRLYVHAALSICALVVLSARALAAEPAAPDEKPSPPADEQVVTPRSHQFNLRSKNGQREYRIQVAEPKGIVPTAGYPVIYALDGNAVFATFAETVRVQRRAGILIVGIGYASDEPFDSARSFDFTPARPSESGDGSKDEKSGGQDEFLSFIQDVLKPEIEKRFKVNRERQTLFGHSLGGLFVLHVLYTQPDAFQMYVAGSPSLWWNDQSILAEEKAFHEKNGAKVDLFLYVGERDARHMVLDAERLAERLAPLSADGLRVYFQNFASEDHVSVLPAAISRAYRLASDAGFWRSA